jgi:hypothetical protein
VACLLKNCGCVKNCGWVNPVYELWTGEPGLLTGFVEAGYGFGFSVVDVEDG